MKKRIFTAVIIACIAFLGSARVQGTTDNEALKRELGYMQGNAYINDTFRIRLTFPADYEYKANPLSPQHQLIFENYFRGHISGPSEYSLCVFGNTKSNPNRSEYVMFHVERAWPHVLYNGKVTQQNAMYYATAMLKAFGQSITRQRIDWLPTDYRVINGIKFWVGHLELTIRDNTGKTVKQSVLHHVAVIDKYFIAIQEFYVQKDGERIIDYASYPGFRSVQVLNSLQRY